MSLFWNLFLADMQQSKLVSLLRPLTVREMRSLAAYVQSPYFNRHEQVIALMELLHEAHPEFAAASLVREEVGARIFGKNPYRDQQLSDVMTYLTRLVCDFLADNQYRKDPVQRRRYLGQAYRERGMDDFFQKYLAKAPNQSLPLYLPEQQYEHYLWEREQVLHLSDHKTRTVHDHFQRMVTHLDTYYLMMKLRYGCEMLNRNRVQRQDFDLDLLNLMLDFIGKQLDQWTEQPLIEAYYRVCLMLQEEAQTDLFIQADAFIRTRHAELPVELLRDLYAYLLNYCIRRINTGDVSFQEILFGQYQWQLETEILLADKWLSPWDYKNIVSLGLKMEKFDWVDRFIETYRLKLKPTFRENAHRYNLAYLRFAQGAYHKALHLLQNVEFDDVFYQIGSKVILLKTYYETEDFEALFYLADASEAYFRRNREIPAYQTEIYLNFIRFLRKLSHVHIRLRSTYRLVDKKQMESLRRRIMARQKVAQIEWLVRKVELLEM